MAVQKVTKSTNGYNVIIKNIGGYPSPLDLLITYEDGSTETLHETPIIWMKDLKETMVDVLTKKKIKSLVIEGGIFMDADESNNSWKP